MEDLKELPDGLVVSLLPTQTHKVIRPSEDSVYIQGLAGEDFFRGPGLESNRFGVYPFFSC